MWGFVSLPLPIHLSLPPFYPSSRAAFCNKLRGNLCASLPEPPRSQRVGGDISRPRRSMLLCLNFPDKFLALWGSLCGPDLNASAKNVAGLTINLSYTPPPCMAHITSSPPLLRQRSRSPRFTVPLLPSFRTVLHTFPRNFS